MAPAGDVGLVLVGNTHGEPVNGDRATLGEMENVFLAVVQEPGRIDRLEMAVGLGAVFAVNGDGFDPVDGVLELETAFIGDLAGNLEGEQEIGG